MSHKRCFFVIALVTFVLALTSCKSEPSLPSTRIVGYYTAWSAAQGYPVTNIPARSLTHVNYAFANVSSAGECILGHPEYDVEMTFLAPDSVTGEDATGGNFEQLLQLKQEHPHLKTLISIGGWTWSGEFSNAALTDASRQKFVRSCVELYIEQYSGVFDGIDVDWEYPVSGGLVEGRPEDTENLTLLLENNLHFILNSVTMLSSKLHRCFRWSSTLTQQRKGEPRVMN